MDKKKTDVEVTVGKTEKVENETTRKQKEEAEAIRKRKEQADAAADAEREENARKRAELEEEKRRFEEEKKAEEEASKKKVQQTEALAAAGVALAGSAVKKGGSFGKGLAIGVIIGAIAAFIIAWMLFGGSPETHTSTPQDLDAGPGYTTLDFQAAVLGEATEHQELVVMEQPVQMTTTVNKSGLGNISLFNKAKTMTFYGTGVYTVDLKNLDKDHILVDEDAKTVTLRVPKATLQYLEPDYSKTEFEDTDKGLLAWGDLTLTAEQQNEVQKAIDEEMRVYLTQEEVLAQANDFAEMKVWDTFQPLVTEVSPEFKVVVVLE